MMDSQDVYTVASAGVLWQNAPMSVTQQEFESIVAFVTSINGKQGSVPDRLSLYEQWHINHHEQLNGDVNAKPQSFKEALEELGALGSVKDAPSDLSTNPAYMIQPIQ